MNYLDYLFRMILKFLGYILVLLGSIIILWGIAVFGLSYADIDLWRSVLGNPPIPAFYGLAAVISGLALIRISDFEIKRLALITLGIVCVSLAFVGVFVPGIPTTIFLIIALWAFTKSSKKLRKWLLNHKIFGPILTNWQEHRVVPLRAKILMVTFMILSVILFHYSLQNLYLTTGLIIILGLVARYVISLPNTVPDKTY